MSTMTRRARAFPIRIAQARERYKAIFESVGTQVAVGRRDSVDGNGAYKIGYDLYQDLGSNRWWRMQLDQDPTVGGEHRSMWKSVLGKPTLSVNQDAASWAYSASGWVTTTNVFVYGGSYVRNSVTGATATWTSPADVTSVGVRAFRSTNGGYAKVLIDGSPTRATLRPTAQDEVNAGRLASSALVANGGTLNPTDRLFSSWSATTGNPDTYVTFADDLTAGVHTVQLVVTGYKPTASTDVRLYVSGATWVTTTTTVATAGMDLAPLSTLLDKSSVFEYAVTFAPTGGEQYLFLGNRHGHDVDDSFTITLDGSVVAPADGQVLVGSLAVVNRVCHLTHPEVIGGNVADGVTVDYTMRPKTGLDVDIRIPWGVSGSSRNAYLGMVPTEGNNFPNGRAAGGPMVSLVSDNDANTGNTKSDTLLLWSGTSPGPAFMGCYRYDMPAAVNGWRKSRSFAWLQDRIGGELNKGYFQRVESNETDVEDIAPGDVWRAHLNYRAAWLDDVSVLAV